MDIFETANLEFELQMQKLDHIWESAMDTFGVQKEEFRISPVVEEDMKDLLYNEAASDLGKKVVAVIQKIIDTIKEFCSKMRDMIVEKFSSKEAKEKLKQVEDAISKDPKKANEKVKVADDKKAQAALNEYIKQMAILERKLMNIKLQATKGFKASNKNDAALIISANQILHDMDKLNEKYDKALLDENEELIEMALKDAIRFSDKQLQNVKVDYAAVEKESERVLAEFKKDAQGCDEPVKYNAIQKMANALGTRVRKFIQKKTAVRKKNLGIIFGTAAIGLGVTGYAYYKTNPQVKAAVDTMAKKTGADKIGQKVQKGLADLAAKGAQP